MTWQLAQGTVEFRDEERQHRNRTEQVSKVRREVSEGSAAANASSPTSIGPPSALPPNASCPTCLTDLDEAGFCSICGRMETTL